MQNYKIIKEKKFKNVYFSIRFLSQFKKEEILPRMILSNILNDSSSLYPTKQSITNKLDTLYGASYQAGTSMIGNAMVLSFKMKAIHQRFIKEDISIIDEQLSLLHEFILNPDMENDVFNEKQWIEAKKNVKNTIQRLIDDPSTYCMYQAMKVAGENQPLGISAIIDADEVDKVTMEEVVEAYHKMLQQDQIDILVLGDVEEDSIKEKIEKYLSFDMNVRNEKIKCNYLLKKNEVVQKQYSYRQISQSYITNYYVTNTSNDDEDFSALRVANAIFGQIPSSLLFQEVREKNSLCYSIYSALNAFDGALAISTGVESNSVEKALSLIEKQYERMRTGDFSDELLNTAKVMLVNSLKATYDDPDSIFAFVYRNILLGKEDDIEHVIQEIEKVNRYHVIDVMRKTEFVLSYVVKERDE